MKNWGQRTEMTRSKTTQKHEHTNKQQNYKRGTHFIHHIHNKDLTNH